MYYTFLSYVEPCVNHVHRIPIYMSGGSNTLSIQNNYCCTMIQPYEAVSFLYAPPPPPKKKKHVEKKNKKKK